MLLFITLLCILFIFHRYSFHCCSSYTLFHLYSVFKGCLKIMNSFKLTFFLCFDVDVLQYVSVSRLLMCLQKFGLKMHNTLNID